MSIPIVIGDYEVQDTIGEGGYARVFRCRHRQTGQVAAIKLLKAEQASERGRARFAREVRVLTSLKHSAFAEIHDEGEVEVDGVRVPYFVQTLFDGVELREYTKRKGLGFRERRAIVLQICQAVRHLHVTGAHLHRDLKPENILVSTDGDSGRAKVHIVDLGIAASLEIDGQRAQLTDERAAPGTRAYMAPEQFGEQGADARSEVYTLGLIAFEAITGRHPSVAQNADAAEPTIEDVLDALRDARPLHSWTRGVVGDARFAAILEKAFAHDPAQRYVDVAALVHDLERYEKHEAIEARSPTMLERGMLLARRHPFSTLVVAAILVMELLWVVQQRRVHSANELALSVIEDEIAVMRSFLDATEQREIEAPSPRLRAQVVALEGKLRKLYATKAADRALPAHVYCLRLLARIDWGLGEHDAAIASIDKAHALLDLDEDPENWGATHERVALHELRAGVERDRGAHRAAAEHLDRADELANALTRASPHVEAAWETKLRLTANRATVLRAYDAAAADAAAARARATFAEATVRTARIARDHAKISIEHAELLKATQPVEALTAAKLALEQARALERPEDRFLLVYALDVAGRCALAAKSLDEAADLLGEAARELDALRLARQPQRLLETESRLFANLAEIHAQNGHMDAALDADVRARDRQRRLVASFPSKPGLREQLILMLYHGARHRNALERADTAAQVQAWMDEALDHCDRMPMPHRLFQRARMLYHWATELEDGGAAETEAKLREAGQLLKQRLRAGRDPRTLHYLAKIRRALRALR